MSPKVVDKVSRRREIALAALDLFADKGFEGTSMSQIAKACDISKGGIYLYFASKDDLIQQAVGVWIETFLDDVGQEVDAQQPPDERLRSLVCSMVQFFMPEQRSLKIAAAIFQLYVTNPELWNRYALADELFSGARKTIADILLEGVSQGIFLPELAKDAEKTAINLVAFLDGIALHYYMSKGSFDLRGQVDQYLDMLLKSAMAPRGQRGAAQ